MKTSFTLGSSIRGVNSSRKWFSPGHGFSRAGKIAESGVSTPEANGLNGRSTCETVSPQTRADNDIFSHHGQQKRNARFGY
jgi:hypothetical protein